MKETIVLAAKLFIIATVATAILAIVNNMTAPIVAAREKTEFETSLSRVFSDADEFKSLKEIDIDKFDKVVEGNKNIADIVFAFQNGEEVGYVLKVIGKGGYGGPITFVVGVDKDNTILGYEVLVSQETSGFGSQVAEDPFVSSVIGKKLQGEMVKAANPTEDNEIQAIAGTTISVKAILNGLNGAILALEQLGA